MEDRITTGLYLELGDLDPGHYGAHRASELADRRGVERVTWWENNVPGRTELPMAVVDGTLLGVAEVDESFTAPDPLPGTTARHFRHVARPSQGILTGAPTTGLLIVWISPQSPAQTQALRDWGDFVHIRHIASAAIPGFTHVTPYENTADGDPRYMHFYELDAEDPEAAYMSMARHMAKYFEGSKTKAFEVWADWKAAGGQVIYCNTFRLLGASSLRLRTAGAGA
ncbi:MAG TPA: hypothetical protein VMU64_14820 [Acidimicrobiales bacterium]|nr:hypothetical protein [Acidimicrobiales bacterium]